MSKQAPQFSLSLSYYKAKVGELQMAYSLPYHDTAARKDKAGAFYLTIAKPFPGSDGKKMDWANKIVFKLSGENFCQIRARFLRGLFPIAIVHDNHGVKTNLFVEPGKEVTYGDAKGLMSYKWTLKRNDNIVSTYLDASQVDHLFMTCEGVVPALYGWGWLDEGRMMMQRGESTPQRPHTFSQQDASRDQSYYDGGYQDTNYNSGSHGQPVPPPEYCGFPGRD